MDEMFLLLLASCTTSHLSLKRSSRDMIAAGVLTAADFYDPPLTLISTIVKRQVMVILRQIVRRFAHCIRA